MLWKMIFLIFIVFSGGAAFAAQPTALFLLDAQPNIRLYSMGGLFSSVNQNDAVYNPWELGYAVNRSAYFAHWPGAVLDSNYNFVSGVLPLKKFGAFNFSYLAYGTGSEDITELDGSIKSIKLEDNKIISIGYGKNIGQTLFAGIGLKSLSSSLADTYSASAMLFDIGIVYRTLDDKHSFGAAFANFGGKLKYYQTKEAVPTEFKLGYSRKIKPYPNQKLVWGLGYSKSEVSKSYSAGIEYFPNIPFISLRTGICKKDDATEFLAGFGFNFKSFDMDFGYDVSSDNVEEGKSPVRFSLNWTFGSKDEYAIAEKYMAKGMKEKAVALWENIKPYEKNHALAQKSIYQYANPPEIFIAASMEDESNDGILSPGERGDIIVSLRNNGRGKALNVRTFINPSDKIKALGNIDLGFYDGSIESLEPGQSASFKVPIKAFEESEKINLAFNISAKEARGFNAEPALFNLRLKGFSPPQLALARYTFREDNSGNSIGNGNGIIEKGEQAELTGYAVNAGLTAAKGASLEVVSLNSGIEIAPHTAKYELGTLKPNEYKKVVILFKVSKDYAGPKKLPINIRLNEERAKFSKTQNLNLALGSFYKDTVEPIFQDFDTASSLAALPNLSGPISDAKAQEVMRLIADEPPVLEFDKTVLADGDANGNGVYEPGEKLKIKVGIRNTGGKPAENVKVVISGNKTIETLLENQSVGDIYPGNYQAVILEAKIPDNIPREEISFNIKITESGGFNANKVEEVKTAFMPKKIKIIKQLASLLPVPNAYSGKNLKAAALIVGISDYNEDIGSLKYSAKDAEIAAKYLNGVMGVQENETEILLNEKATGSRIKAFVNKMAAKDDLELLVFYFSGHGMPDPDNQTNGADPYMVPYDADLGLKDTLIGLNTIVSKLEKSRAKNIVIILDSCFSGKAGRTPKLFAMKQKGIGIIPKFAQERALVISGSKGNQASLEFDKVGHGYFTYYLLLGMKGEADKDRNGSITDKEICSYIAEKMKEELGARQTPICSNEGGFRLGRYK